VAIPLAEHTIPLAEHTIPLAEHTIPLAEHTIPLAEHTIPCTCQLTNAVRLSTSLTVPKLFKVHTVHSDTVLSGRAPSTVICRSGLAEGLRRRLSNVADPFARRIAVAAGFCNEGEMCLL
jgi:hypothetical protein